MPAPSRAGGLKSVARGPYGSHDMPTDLPTRILVVDDNPSIHEDFRKILRPSNEGDPDLTALEASLFEDDAEPVSVASTYEIDCADQGLDGVAMVCAAVEEQRPYSLAFVDVRMPPGMDGIETLNRLWQADPNLQAVICTAYSDHSWASMVAQLGRTDQFLVLKKPFDPIEVLQLAESLTTKWVLAREVTRQIDDLETRVAERTRALEAANRELRGEVDARRTAEDELRKLATHDALTGLPNRLMLQDRTARALARGRRQGSKLGVLLLDLDGFKAINDSLGHAAGDELLRQTAARLRSAVRQSDTVARMGGDEFVVLAEDLADPEDAALVAERVREACSEPVVVQGQAVRSTPSIGIALWPGDGDEAEALLKCADLAMYQAKQAGGGAHRFFDDRMLETSVQRLQLRADLEAALPQGQLDVWYQPLFDLEQGTIRGMEALLRWEHPQRGMVSPMTFIAEAERSGLIVPIGRWVLESACAQLARWRAAGAADLTVAVNVSARQLRDEGFVDVVAETLQTSGLEPGCLELEITESAAFANFELAQSVLARLADLGVRILIDDFGSGFSSLNRLKSLAVDGLKIDRFFVDNVADDPRDAAIVKAIVSMAHSLGIDVVAEGIETTAQLERLRALEWEEQERPVCDRAQGFLLGRPVPASEATALLQAGSHGPTDEPRAVL